MIPCLTEMETKGGGVMTVQVYGCNHIAIEVDDIEKAVAFYQDVFNLEKLRGGEGDAFFKLGEHQFLAMFEVKHPSPNSVRHFGLMVRDEKQLAEVREKVSHKYGLSLIPGFRCDFRDPFGNRIQVVDLHDESLVWLLPYQEVQKAGIRFSDGKSYRRYTMNAQPEPSTQESFALQGSLNPDDFE